MADIFRAAEKVVVWLGAEDEYTNDAKRVIESIGSIQHPRKTLKSLVQYTSFFNDHECYKKLGIPNLTYFNWLGFIAFINRPYFQRTWIIQELALAKSAVIVCGNTVLPWNSLSRTLSFIRELKWYHHLSASKLRHVNSLRLNPGKYGRLLKSNISVSMAPLYLNRTRAMLMHSQQQQESGSSTPGQSLTVLVETHRFTKTTDPRDKIFAFLGIADRNLAPLSTESTRIQPDYSLSVQKVYLNFAQAVLLSSKNLRLLCHVQDPGATAIQNLPSWVPDYSVPQQPYTLRLRGRPSWSASGSTQWKWKGHEDAMSKGLLHVQGYKVDIVEETAKLTSETDNPASAWSSIVQVTASLDSLYPIKFSEGARPSRFEVLWRTMMTNTYARSHPAPSECGKLFIDYILNLQIRHQLVPWSNNIEFQPHQMPLSQLVHPQWHSLLESEPKESPYGLQLYESRFSEVISSIFKGEYSPIGLAQLHHEIEHASGNVRRVFRTRNKLLGTGTKSLKSGDEIWILHGCPLPFVLRQLPSGNYQLIGETYVHGLMHGEALEEMRLPVEEIVIE
jgi:hypothetical protein